MLSVTLRNTHPTQTPNTVFSTVNSRLSALHRSEQVLHLRHTLNKYFQAFVNHRAVNTVFT